MTDRYGNPQYDYYELLRISTILARWLLSEFEPNNKALGALTRVSKRIVSDWEINSYASWIAQPKPDYKISFEVTTLLATDGIQIGVIAINEGTIRFILVRPGVNLSPLFWDSLIKALGGNGFTYLSTG